MKKQKQSSLLSHLISVLILPFNVTIIIPALLLFFFQQKLGAVLIALGAIFILSGLLLVVITVKHFATRGKGTLAPWDPPKKLVVSGPYQYSRNPMISGVACILLGEAIAFGSLPILLWFILFITVNYLYFIFGEEPRLTKRFGEDYLQYKKHVPRLFPRRTPWRPADK
ncbi:isoprenylcysteine carboxylmethyltransferase family protein [Bacillus sp. B15-48]|uniref:methyltransferase family protein n=1 Tax=Bacillus sp. B15-48 TaxID=1548601 RepID=UPI00193FD764|nr:isoprenylcysteine carboxylmethyltransferase family protein [Bacillus sp. B15-48]MBM4761591.1 isoprenylcysteine carboxylmethyltransferase family protein [Bacillus sp. B15-48]